MLEQHFTWLMNKSYSHVHELLHLYSPSPSLHSASDTRMFRVPRVCRRTLGERSFQCIGPVIWNSLSFSVRHATSLSSFKSKLKTTSSLLPTDFSLSFFCFHLTHDYYACVFAVCACGWGCLWVCVRVWVWHAYLLCKRPGLS